MAMQLFDYQQIAVHDIYGAWRQGLINVLYVLATGGGKTVIFSDILKNFNGESCAIAHRRELLEQMSITLGRNGVYHKIIGPQETIRLIVKRQIEELGTDFYRTSARVTVASVDSLVNRKDGLRAWASKVGLWVMDEAHHLLEDNKWGTAAKLFTNARGLGVTATPGRADGKGLGRHAHGLMDTMLFGPSMRDLINQGFLTDYRLICPESTLDLTEVNTGKDGDFVRKRLGLCTRQSSVLGDVVAHYQRFAHGLRGVTFVPDVATAEEQAVKFRTAGIPAEAISAQTPSRERAELLQRFKRGELWQLVNCDLFGEGFDLPAIGVISMARATLSFPLFAQQFGRALRVMEGKERAIILDHVGNILRHNVPDKPRVWSLDNRERRSRSEAEISLRICSNKACLNAYEKQLSACPICGTAPRYTEVERSSPKFVDGDLFELSDEAMRALRGEIERVDKEPSEVRNAMEHAGHPRVVALSAAKRHRERQESQEYLRTAMEWWSGIQRARGMEDRARYRKFFADFNIDPLSAKTLGRNEAEQLRKRIFEKLYEECS